MSIWAKPLDLEVLNSVRFLGGLNGHLGIRFVSFGDNHLCASMPADEHTLQPFGILHGGASAALAETVGSVASGLTSHQPGNFVGLSINASHLRAVTGGLVTARAEPLHLGSSTHVWDIRIRDEEDRLTCVCRLTMMRLAG